MGIISKKRLNLYKLSISKDLFEDILMKKSKTIVKKSTKYWQKELIEPFLDKNDTLNYKIKSIDKLELTNGLNKENPKLIVSLQDIEFNQKTMEFIFHINEIIEQKNIKLKTDYKDLLIQELLKEREELKHNLNTDELTKLSNRKKMNEDLKVFTNQSNSSFLSAVFIDTDNFKDINSKYGYSIADMVLVHLADKIKRYSGVLNSTAYRYGGGQFALFSFLNEKDLIKGLNDLRESISSHSIFTNKGNINITVSIGIGFYSEIKDSNELLESTNKALNYAKNTGKNKVVRF